jgi:hypothetical protein
MVVCDRVNVELPEELTDVDIEAGLCALPEGVNSVAPGQQLTITLTLRNQGADSGTADIVIQAVPARLFDSEFSISEQLEQVVTENPDSIIELGRLREIRVPAQNSKATQLVVEAPSTKETYQFVATTDNQEVVSV